MQTIGGFLERYKNFIPPPLAAARAVKAAIFEALGIEVGDSAVTVKNGRADVVVSSLEKTEILLNREKILSGVRARVGDAVKDIR